MDILKLIEEIDSYTKSQVKQKRYEHSVRVAQMAARMCRQYGLDENLGYLAGIGHDMCKDLSDEDLIKTAARDGEPIIPYEYKQPKLLHGRAAAVVMKEKFGITNPDVLEAVANHTSGKEGMCDLTKVIFVADKIEPGRPQSTDEYRNRLFELDFDTLFYTVFKENYDYINNKGFEIYPGTDRMLKCYEEFVK